ncbi:type IX secretion system membrane protein PorP/SprF [Cytophaga aurantiaca]|uniref:type IX secretion system membrane protein PorP/SprF n=1 Tax=Cytophaga aurantiaca TaxID=29530 RepID=UPI0003796511|nr:type IX secretion system membrane protein PorP/SprF [Cytophaga aurantiaca]
MRKNIFFCFSTVFLLNLAFKSHAQTGDDNPIIFDQFFQNYYLLNPASSDSSDRVQVSIGNRSLVGLFEGVNRLYVDGSLRLKHNEASSQFSRIGILVIAYNDGAFIKRTRAYARYSWSTRLGARSSLSGGIAAGAVNYSFLGSQAGGGGASTAFDVNIGMWYIRRKLKIGASYQQMTGSAIAPVNQKFELKPYINLNAIYTTYISPHVALSTHAYVRLQSKEKYDVQLAPVFLINELFETGVNLRYKRGVAVLFGLKSISIGQGNLRFMGSFLFSTRKLANNFDNAFELSAGYTF